GTELLTARVQLVTEKLCGQRCVDKSGGDEVHPDWRELEREVLCEGGTRGRECREEIEAGCRASRAGAPHEKQCPSRPNLARGIPSDLQRQQKMSFDVAAKPFNVELRQRRIVRTGASDQHVVNRCRQLVEEPFEPVEVGGVEGRDAGSKLQTHTVQTVGIACREGYRWSSPHN